MTPEREREERAIQGYGYVRDLIDRAERAEAALSALRTATEASYMAQAAATQDAIRERDELRAALAGLREAATHLVQHIDEALDYSCPDRTCGGVETDDGGLDHDSDCLVATLTRALAAAPADLAAQYRAEVRRATLLEAAARLEAAQRDPLDAPVTDWLRALAAKEGP